jgi:DNA mismatch repair protein PMS2
MTPLTALYPTAASQHATDEKYNFERLYRDTVMRTQRLIVPKPLELAAINESILADHLEVFRKNGFDFVIDSDAPPMKRVKMTAVPYSKGTEFGMDGQSFMC